MLVHLEMSQKLLGQSFLCVILFSSCFSGENAYFLCVKSMIWISASSPPLLVPYRFFFISFNVTFIYAQGFYMPLPYSMGSLKILITSVLNSASDRLFISISFSSFSGILFCSFIWAIVLCLFNLAATCVCFCVLCRAALTLCLSSRAYCRKRTCKMCGAEP